jgi:hypothetical protein
MRRLVLVLIFLSARSWSINVDRYVGPFGFVSFPLYSVENSYNNPNIASAFRYGFRVEAGSISDNLSFDFRFNTRSSYTDFGFIFRYFYCWGENSTFAFCPGLGAGASFSPGFTIDPAGRSFMDLLANINFRWMFDVSDHTVLAVDTGILTVPSRNFSTDSPTSNDGKPKTRFEIGFGFLSDFVEVGEAIGFGNSEVSRGNFELPGFSFGLKGGFPLSKYKGLNSVGESYSGPKRTGIMGGLSMEAGSGQFGFMADLFYTARRIGIDDTTSGLFERVEIPLLLRYRSEGANYIYGTAGGFVAIPMGPAAVVTGSVTTAVEDIKYKTDYGYNFGLGWGIYTQAVLITFELRFQNGIPNLVPTPTGSESAKTRVLDLLIGFLY